MTNDVIHPRFHHVNLKTTRLPEMIDFCSVLVGAEVIHQDAAGAWLRANPIGQFVDPAAVAADHAAGASFEEIHAKAISGGYAPQEAPVAVPQASA